MNLLEFLVNFSFGIILTSFMIYVLYYIFNIQIKIKKVIIFMVVFGLVQLGGSFIHLAVKQIVLVALFVLLSKLIMKVKYIKSILGGVLGFIFLATGDMFAGVILHTIMGIPKLLIKSSLPYLSLAYLISMVFAFVFATVFKRFSKAIGFGEELNYKNSAVAIIYMIFIMLFEGLLVQVFSMTPNNVSRVYIVSFFVLMILFMAINFVVLLINKRFYSQKNEYEQLKMYTDIVDNLVSDIRKFRHDYVNTTSALAGYLEIKDYVGLENYYKEDMMRDGKIITNGNNMLKLSKLKNPAIKGLISSKIVHAESMGINLDINIDSEIDKIPAKTIDICKVLGILIDNAIESAIETQEKSVDINMLADKENIIFLVSNTYKILPSIHDMFKEGFSTKGENRGLGLSTVKSVVNGYKNMLLNNFVEGSKFTMELSIGK